MSRIRRNKVGVLATAVTAIVVLVAAVGTASAIIIKSGNIEAELDGGISPSALPKKEKAPLTLKLEGSLKTLDGTHLPAAKTITLDFDKAGELFTKGLPTCKTGQLESTLTAQAKSTCKDAIVGSGVVKADIALPEQQPFSAQGPLVIFNGAPKGGKQILILHVHANVPAPTTFVVPVEVKKTGGKYGTNAFIKVPTIVSGNGSVTDFKATLSKKWTTKGKKASLISASCPTGALFVKGDISFADGNKLNGVFSEKCTPKG